MKKISILMLVALIGLVSFSMVGSAQELEGTVKIDGSSTVYPHKQWQKSFHM